jgi:hypothetical protein
MSDGILTKLADALAVNRELDAPEVTSTRMTASLKVLEASIMARLAAMSDDQRTKVVNSAIDILRSQNAGWEAEEEVRRIMASSDPRRIAVLCSRLIPL